MRQFTSCKKCGRSGWVHFRPTRSGLFDTEDHIEHDTACPYARVVQPRHLRRQAWRKHEVRANQLVGVRDTAASGAVGEDGDGREFGEWRVETKSTAAPTYLLTQTVWSKLADNARSAGEVAVLYVQTASALRIVVPADWACRDVNPSGQRTYHVGRTFGMSEFLPVPLDPPAVEITKEQFQCLQSKNSLSSSRGP